MEGEREREGERKEEDPGDFRAEVVAGKFLESLFSAPWRRETSITHPLMGDWLDLNTSPFPSVSLSNPH